MNRLWNDWDSERNEGGLWKQWSSEGKRGDYGMGEGVRSIGKE